MNTAPIPMKTVGPIKIVSDSFIEEISIPLATYESPLWYAVNRGAKVSRTCAGIHVTLIDDCMTRAILLEASDAKTAHDIEQQLQVRLDELRTITENTSRFAKLQQMHSQIIGNLLYLRFRFATGDAAGHNMVTKASEQLQSWILSEYNSLQYISISGNYCTDKKTSAVNGILGRGKYVIAEINIPKTMCEKMLRTTPEKIVNLNIKKNLIGSIISGSLRTANAHFANILLALYLATGQDAANIIEGSQGITHAEVKNNDLYFSVTLPNLIIGTMGNGKDLPFVQNNLKMMDCLPNDNIGSSATRLALITAASVLCGELSLLAAQTNPSELMRSHLSLERRGS